jgi:hypothetical protein
MIWLLVVFLSHATGFALIAGSHPVDGSLVIVLFFVLSLPFVLYAFVTTLIHHILLVKPIWSLLLRG